MSILKIARMGHPVLKRVAAAVADPTAPELHRLIGDMLETMEDAEGTGLAPPEVVLGGRYVIAIGDEKLIRSDAIANFATSMIGVLLLFLLAFRRFGPLLYAFVPLTVGLILTFGLASILFGGLSAATSGTGRTGIAA